MPGQQLRGYLLVGVKTWAKGRSVPARGHKLGEEGGVVLELVGFEYDVARVLVVEPYYRTWHQRSGYRERLGLYRMGRPPRRRHRGPPPGLLRFFEEPLLHVASDTVPSDYRGVDLAYVAVPTVAKEDAADTPAFVAQRKHIREPVPGRGELQVGAGDAEGGLPKEMPQPQRPGRTRAFGHDVLVKTGEHLRPGCQCFTGERLRHRMRPWWRPCWWPHDRDNRRRPGDGWGSRRIGLHQNIHRARAWIFPRQRTVPEAHTLPVHAQARGIHTSTKQL